MCVKVMPNVDEFIFVLRSEGFYFLQQHAAKISDNKTGGFYRKVKG